MIGRGRAERDFSTAHTGGDLSLPDRVKQKVEPNLFPIVRETGWTGKNDAHDAEVDREDPSSSPESHR